MPQVAIEIKKKLIADLPPSSKIVFSDENNVTWYRKDAADMITLSTCNTGDFECQNATLELQLSKGEFQALAKALAKDMSW